MVFPSKADNMLRYAGILVLAAGLAACDDSNVKSSNYSDRSLRPVYQSATTASLNLKHSARSALK